MCKGVSCSKTTPWPMKGVQDGMVQSPGVQGKGVHRFAWRADREALAVSVWLGQRTLDGWETAGQPVALGEGRGARLLPWLSTPTACSGQEWLRSFDGQTLVTRDKELTGGRARTLPSKAPQDGQSGFRVIHQGQGCILGHSQGLPCRSQQRHQETRVCLASRSVKLCSRNFAAALNLPLPRGPTNTQQGGRRKGGRKRRPPQLVLCWRETSLEDCGSDSTSNPAQSSDVMWGWTFKASDGYCLVN